MAWTSDDGATWRNITPLGAQVRRIIAVFFLNTLNGWVLTVQPEASAEEVPSLITVFRTSDGGATWASASFAGPPVIDPGPPELFGTVQFVDSQHGWFSGVRKTGMMGTAQLYRTTNGGVTWSKLTPPDEGLFVYTARFVDAEEGWLAAISHLYVTHDGGASWESRALPAPPGCDTITKYMQISVPVFDDPKHGALSVSGRCSDESPDHTWFYISNDGGKSWKVSKTVTDNHGASIVDSATWFTTRRDALLETTDAGKHWASFVSVPYKPPLIGFDFTNASEGWAILYGESFDELLATSDGGHTWKLLQP